MQMLNIDNKRKIIQKELCEKIEVGLKCLKIHDLFTLYYLIELIWFNRFHRYLLLFQGLNSKNFYLSKV